MITRWELIRRMEPEAAAQWIAMIMTVYKSQPAIKALLEKPMDEKEYEIFASEARLYPDSPLRRFFEEQRPDLL